MTSFRNLKWLVLVYDKIKSSEDKILYLTGVATLQVSLSVQVAFKYFCNLESVIVALHIMLSNLQYHWFTGHTSNTMFCL